MPGRVVDVCRSKCKGGPKEAIPEGRLVAGCGLEGDAHAGDGHRQLSLLALDDIDEMRAHGLELESGAFGENLVIDGVDVAQIGVGSRLTVGNAVLEVSQIGKECHSRCAIFYTAGDCIMPRSGIFARVVRGGIVCSGTPVVLTPEVASEVETKAASIPEESPCEIDAADDRGGC